MKYDPPLLNSKCDKNGPYLAQLQAGLMKAVADQETQYQEPALTTNPFPETTASNSDVVSMNQSQQGRKRPLMGSADKPTSPTSPMDSDKRTISGGWGAPPLSPRTSLASQRAKSPTATTAPIHAWQQETTAPNTITTTTSPQMTRNHEREKTQVRNQNISFFIFIKQVYHCLFLLHFLGQHTD